MFLILKIMNREKLEEIKKLPLKDRIVAYSENDVNYILNYIDRTKYRFDYARYIICNNSKSGFYNGHSIDGDAVAEEYSNMDNMLLLKTYDIIVFPVIFLNHTKLNELPDLKYLYTIIRFLSDGYGIELDDIMTYKTKLEYKHTWSELADYENVGDYDFIADKFGRIEKLRAAHCETYDDYNRICQR